MVSFWSKPNKSVALVLHFMNYYLEKFEPLLFFENWGKVMTNNANKTFQGNGKYMIKG